MTLKEKLQKYIDIKGISVNEFERSIGVSKSYWRNTKSISAESLLSIIKQYPDIDVDWLISNDDFSRSSHVSIGSNIGNNNRIESNSGTVGVGNTINVTLPETGTQKIINPDGKIELSSTASNESAFDELTREIASLKEKISLLTDNMKVKDDLIAALRANIKLLEHKQ